MRILAEQAGYMLTLHEGGAGGSGPLVVTFGGRQSKLAPSGFGTGWCLDRGWDTIYVAQRAGSQYQDLPLEAFFDAVAPLAERRDLVCYGSGLGAYAALYYGGSLDARIVAAAPMLPAWPPLNRAADAIPLAHPELHDVPRSVKPPVVLFDPMVADDRLMVDEMVMPAYPDLRPVELEDAGPNVLETLKAAGLIGSVMTALIAEDRIIPVDLTEADNPLWHFWRGKRLAKLDPEAARLHLEKSLALQPSRHVIGNLLALLLRVRDLGAAQALVNRVLASDDGQMVIPEGNLGRARAAGLDLGALQ